jgi:hypothetical protein
LPKLPPPAPDRPATRPDDWARATGERPQRRSSIERDELKATRYFTEQVLRKRPYIQADWCLAVVASPIRRGTQGDGRIRFWGQVVDSRDGRTRFLRVVTLEDGETVHNAFFDRDFETGAE